MMSYKFLSGFLFVLMFLSPRTAAAQGPSPQAIVDSMYPVARLDPESVEDRRTCYQIAAVAADGTPTRIVAGYTDREMAMLRVLDRAASGTFEASYDSPGTLAMFGIQCTIELLDMDGDGTKDVFLKVESERGSTGWVFRIVGTTIEHVTPVSGITEAWGSELTVPSVLDLYHDGSLQIATAGGWPEEPGGRVSTLASVYKFVASALVLDSPVLLATPFGKSAPPRFTRDTFSLQEGATGSYVLRITNGARGGEHRATGIAILINDVPVPGTGALSAETEFLDLPISVPLKDENMLKVTLTGAEDARVVIVIRSPPE
jgi:hypothetical protein